MKKITPSKLDAFLFYREIIDSLKPEPIKIKILQNLENELKGLFSNYETAFTSNRLMDLIPFKLSQEEKDYLISLYRPNRKAIKNLFITLTTGINNNYVARCPYCSNNEVFTLDHFLPKNVFPEYSVLPKNLIPSCPICNNHKRSIYNGLWNPYLDTIPENQQFLYVNLSINQGVLEVNFYLKNNEGIDPNLFSKIEKTYKVLKLCERYRASSKEKLEELVKEINMFVLKGGSIESTKIELLKEFEFFYQDKGRNYWVYVFKKACIENDQVFKYLNKAKLI